MDYREAYGEEAISARASYGIKILVAVDRELNANDKRVIRDAACSIAQSLQAESYSTDLVLQAAVAKQKTDLLALFPAPIYVQKLPNGYCPNDPYWRQFPWFQVTTTRGLIKIGWRKRVIEIDWQESEITTDPHELFPGEDVTKGTYSIHAWSYDKAREYLQKIMAAK